MVDFEERERENKFDFMSAKMAMNKIYSDIKWDTWLKHI